MASTLSAEVRLENFLWCLWAAGASIRQHNHHTRHMIADLIHAPTPHERQFPEPPAPCHPLAAPPRCQACPEAGRVVQVVGEGPASTASHSCPWLMDKWPPEQHGLEPHLGVLADGAQFSCGRCKACFWLLQHRATSRGRCQLEAWQLERPGTPAAAGIPQTLGTFQGSMSSQGQPASVQRGTEAPCGGAGTPGLLGGCGPPVWHRCSQGHPAALCGSDVERALDFL